MVPEGTKGNFKRLIVCCDGTWMSSDQAKSSKENPTNITRFCRALENVEVLSDGSEIQQVVYYQRGIGTGEMNALQRAIAGGTGYGLDQNVREAYFYLANNYQDGDELYIFGFSRGAYTARAISGLIGDIGLLNKYGIPFFPDIYKQYQARLSNMDAWEKYQADKDLAKYRQPNVRMRVLGCWDTVGSLGIPQNPIVEKLQWNKKYYFYDTQLSSSVENAFHVLALDEHRTSFVPTLWYLKPEDAGAVVPVPAKPDDPDVKPAPRLPPINLIQTWFAGVHGDVAGGADPSGYNECADVTFAWMIEQCKHLLVFDPEYIHVQTTGHATFRQKDIAKKVAAAEPPGADAASVKNAMASSDSSLLGYAAGPISDSFTGIFRAGGSTHRKPGQYFKDENKGATNEFIHPSVRIRRIKTPLWTPPSLTGFQVKEDPDSPGTWVWSKTLPDGTVVNIPEYRIEEKEKENDVLIKKTPGTPEGLKHPELALMTDEDRAMLEGGELPSPVEVNLVTGSLIWRKMRLLIGR